MAIFKKGRRAKVDIILGPDYFNNREDFTVIVSAHAGLSPEEAKAVGDNLARALLKGEAQGFITEGWVTVNVTTMKRGDI